jgi:hypothetical protein
MVMGEGNLVENSSRVLTTSSYLERKQKIMDYLENQVDYATESQIQKALNIPWKTLIKDFEMMEKENVIVRLKLSPLESGVPKYVISTKLGKIQKFINQGENWKLIFYFAMENIFKERGEENIKQSVSEIFSGNPDDRLDLRTLQTKIRKLARKLKLAFSV